MAVEGDEVMAKQLTPKIFAELQEQSYDGSREEHKFSVSPDMAKNLVAAMHPNQRRVSPQQVEQVRRWMNDGVFIEDYLGAPGVWLDAVGYVVNCQHRLLAQIEQGLTLVWTFSLGRTEDEIRVLDLGRKRRDVDGLNLTMGKDEEGNYKKTISGTTAAAYKQLQRLLCYDPKEGNGKLPAADPLNPNEILELHEAYGSEFERVVQAVPRKMGPASLRAALTFIDICNKQRKAEHEVFRLELLAAHMGKGTQYGSVQLLNRYLNENRGRYGTAYTDDIIRKTLAAVKRFYEEYNGGNPKRLIKVTTGSRLQVPSDIMRHFHV